MEQQNRKFRLRLNLFDGIVLLVALAVGVFLLWSQLKPSAPSGNDAAPNSATVRYTVRLQRWMENTSALIHEGDLLVDVVKNYELGHVVSYETLPSEAMTLDQNSRQFILTPYPESEDVLVTVEAPCTITDESILLSGGYTLRVGSVAYIRGSGYMGSGPIVSIEREGLE